MTRRQFTRRLNIFVGISVGVLAAVALAVLAVVGGVGAAVAVLAVSGLTVVAIGVAVGVAVGVIKLVVVATAYSGRRTRSSDLLGGLGGLRVSLGGTVRRLLHACTSVDRLVDYLLDRTAAKLPEAAGARFAEEWQDHRQHYSGWRLAWWALCVRATAMRTVTALGPARLRRDS